MNGLTTNESSNEGGHDWKSEIGLLTENPRSLCSVVGTRPRLSKNLEQTILVQEEWKAELDNRSRMWKRQISSSGRSLLYKDPIDGSILYGHVISPVYSNRDVGHSEKFGPSAIDSRASLPCVIFFQTGAGPHDIFLHWKAHSLVTDVDTFHDGCVVLIADFTSDDRGWGWDNDKTRYNDLKADLMKMDDQGGRPFLRRRIMATLEAVKTIEGVDLQKIAVLTWCVGATCATELARMDTPGFNIRCMASYHGVFDNASTILDLCQKDDNVRDKSQQTDSPKKQMLIFHGLQDPLAKIEGAKISLGIFRLCGFDTSFIELDGAKHSFTTPAAACHPTPEKFGYSKIGAEIAWESTRKTLRNVFNR